MAMPKGQGKIHNAEMSSKLQLAPSPQLWAKQPKESDQAYEAWQLYLKLKDEKAGGIVEVARRLKKSVALIGRWSQRWRWVERFRAYENHQVLLIEKEQQKAAREAAKVWAKRKIEIREVGFEIGLLMISRCKQLLALPLAEKEVKGKVIDQHGKEVETVTVLNFQSHPRDARLFAQTGLQMMRLSAEMSTENLALIAPDVDLDAMDDEQLEAYAHKLAEMRKAILEEEKN